MGDGEETDSPFDETSDPEAQTAPLQKGHPAARSFPWETLESYTSEAASTTRRLAALLPRSRNPYEALGAVADCLETQTGLSHDLQYLGMHLRNGRDECRPVFGDAFVTQFRLPPGPELGALAIEMEAVDTWLTHLLGAPRSSRRLGEVGQREFGLVTFVLLAVLEVLRDRGAPALVVPTEPPPRGELAEALSRAEGVVELEFALHCDGGSHRARIFAPTALLERVETGVGEEQIYEEILGSPLSSLHVELPVTIGRTVLDRPVVEGLEEGDVVLLERHGWTETPEERRAPKVPGGRLYLDRTSRRRHLAVEAGTGGGRAWKVEIWECSPRLTTEGSMTEQRPDEAQTTGTSGGTPREAGETERLEAPEMTLEVEIGSAKITVRELGTLQAGEVLELDREVGDPADLVVDGTKIGEGELVEIEGRLGVRIREIER